jgi:hypothetical protein
VAQQLPLLLAVHQLVQQLHQPQLQCLTVVLLLQQQRLGLLHLQLLLLLLLAALHPALPHPPLPLLLLGLHRLPQQECCLLQQLLVRQSAQLLLLLWLLPLQLHQRVHLLLQAAPQHQSLLLLLLLQECQHPPTQARPLVLPLPLLVLLLRLTPPAG